MSATATCPHCSVSSPVPDEAIGRKVRCKKCSQTFVVEADASPRPKSGRPTSKVPVAAPAPAKGKAKEKKSHALLWIVASIVILAGAGGVGVAVFMMNQDAPTETRKKKKRDDVSALAKNDPKTPAKTAGKKVDAGEPKDPGPGVEKRPAQRPAVPGGPKTPTVFTSNERVVVAPPVKSMPLEIADLADIQEVRLLRNKPNRVALRIREKGQMFFEMVDLNKSERLGKFKIPNDTQLMDVDPDGETLAVSDRESAIHVYGLPNGQEIFDDDWRPYHNIKDEGRFLGGDGNLVSLTLVNKDQLLVLTSRNNGDVWDWRKKKVQFLLPAPPREEFRKESIVRNRDYALSQDHTMFALAGDDGITFREMKEGQPIGKTERLSKLGGKAELLGMGFDAGGGKLTAFLSVQKDGARVQLLARFKVPGGEELGVETIKHPGDESPIEYVGGDQFIVFDKREMELWDETGRMRAFGAFPGKFGIFAPKVAGRQLAYVHLGAKDKVAVSVTSVPEVSNDAAPAAPDPMPVEPKGAEPKATPKNSPKTPPKAASPSDDAGKSLAELLGNPKVPVEPEAKKDEPKKEEGKKDVPPKARPMPVAPDPPRGAYRQERWEFGAQGIVRTGVGEAKD